MSLLGVSTLNASASLAGFAEGAVNVDLDASLFVQLLLFVALLFILEPLLFRPMLKLFEERENRIDKTLQKGRDLDGKSAKALAKYEAILAKARQAGAAERDKLRAEGSKKENEMLASVRAETAATLERGRATMAADANAARAQLAGEVKELGRVVASRVLGREVSS